MNAKAQLAAARTAGFQVGTKVQIKSGGRIETGVVTASNAMITNVTFTHHKTGREMVASWTTRVVKFAA